MGRVVALRRLRPTWGPRKLWWWLQQRYPLGPWPSARTIGRWLTGAGLVARRRCHSTPGPVELAWRPWVARAANDVWSVDFKGPFRTRDGQRVLPLTVQDLATRCILCVRQVPQANEGSVRTALQRIFRRYGLPRVLRVDNGTPFGGTGARGLTTLSVWWLRLGIHVEFIRPGCPQDNGSHEQMHRILKSETANPPAANPAAQQQRFHRWRHHYNRQRPHESLGLTLPLHTYQRSSRAFPSKLPAWVYPQSWPRLQLDSKGRCHWAGRQRHVGRAFIGQQLALRQRTADLVEVYLGPFLLGQLHRYDSAGLRPVRHRYPKRKGAGGGYAPSRNPPHL